MAKTDRDAVVIRPFQNGDAETVFDFFEALSERTRYFFRPYAFTREEAVQFTGEGLANPDIRKYMAVLEADGTEVMVGHVFFWGWSKKVPWLGLAIRDGFQGEGLGKRLMEYALAEAEANHKGGILLTAKEDNFPAQSLYKRMGFEIIGKDSVGEFLFLLNFND